jgi:signal transduction histidine kinase
MVLALALACAALAWWGASHSSFLMERSRLAQEVLVEHLRLQASLDATLRAATLATLSEPPTPFDAEDARAELRERFAAIRRGIAAEVALMPGDADERDELEAAAWLELTVHDLLGRLERVSGLAGAGETELARQLLAPAANEEIRSAVSAAVASERVEVEEAVADGATAMAQVVTLSRVLALAATLFTGGALLLLFRRLRRPLAELTAAARRAATGDLSARIEPGRRQDEFAELIGHFNTMLEELARNRSGLERDQEQLARAVRERTAELANANEILRQGDDSRRRFLADVSHELRTPLTVIRGEAEIALRGSGRDAAAYREALARIAAEAAHTARLVDDLLYVARSEAGAPRIVVQAVAMAELAARAAEVARRLAEPRGVRIQDAPAAGGLVVQGDPDRLRQLLVILLDNAVRYSAPQGEVRLAVGAGPESVVVSISDDGIGIPADELPRIFDRFYRGSGATTQHAGGSGLGLPLARAIARAHGGDVTLESRPGRGTTARVLLPAAQPLKVVA